MGEHDALDPMVFKFPIQETVILFAQVSDQGDHRTGFPLHALNIVRLRTCVKYKPEIPCYQAPFRPALMKASMFSRGVSCGKSQPVLRMKFG